MDEIVSIKKYEPQTRFKDYIQCYWILNCSENTTNTIYNTGLDGNVEIIFNLSDPVECIASDSKPVTITGDFITGSLVKKIQIKPTGILSLFGVRFTPYGLYPFLSMPPVDLADFCMEIEEVWELNGFGLSKLIHSTNQAPENMVRAFEIFFTSRMSEFGKHSKTVEKAVAIIRLHKGQIPIEPLANRLQLSRRHLERKFLKRIGVTPKQLCRIFRIKHVLSKLRTNKCDWASFAADCGYFDQAHFIHDFRFFTGQSPISYLADTKVH